MLFACGSATDFNTLTIDDPTANRDSGPSLITGSFTTAPFDEGAAAGWATLRRLIQTVFVPSNSGGGTIANITITPIADGCEFTGQALRTDLDVTQGVLRILEIPTFVPGTRFQMKVEVTILTLSASAAPLELGESDQWFVYRRPSRKTE